jgi:nicotinamidase-related amidase
MPQRAALLVIDVQRGLVNGFEDDWEDVLPVIAEQIARAREVAAPIVFIQHCGATDTHPLHVDAPGFPLHPAVRADPDDLRVRKTWSDAFAETDLYEKLQRAGARRIVVTGGQTELCVDATVRRGASLGFDVDLVADGHTTSASDLLTREQIIAHHNRALVDLACPGATIRVLPGHAIDWSDTAP